MAFLDCNSQSYYSIKHPRVNGDFLIIMKKHLKIAKAMLVYSWKDFIEYRGHLLFWIILESPSFFVMYFLWTFIYKNYGSVSGYTLSAIITYYFLTYFIKQSTSTHFDWSIIRKINEGYFSQFLFRPLTHRMYYFYQNIGEKMIRFAILIPVFFLLFLVIKKYFLFPDPKNLGFFFLALSFSFLLNLFLSFFVGYTAFWTEKSESLIYFKSAFVFYISGAMIPLSFFGEKISAALGLLPFRYFLSFPIEIYLGKVTYQQIYEGFFIATFWLLVFILLDRLIYHYGIKRFSSVGN